MDFNVSKSKIFLYSLITFITGIAISSFLPKKWLGFDLYFFAGWIFFLVALVLFWKNKKLRLIVFLGMFILLGFWRYSISLITASSDKIWHYNGEEVLVQGMVSSEPDIRDSNVKLEVNLQKISEQGNERLKNTERKINGKVLVTTNLYPEYNYGDKLLIKCRLEAPEEFQGFAYDRYLARFGIYSVCYYPKIDLINREEGKRFYEIIYKIKNRVRRVIGLGMGEPEASLARALVLGDRRGIPQELLNSYSQSGISHIIAVSGLNITILVAITMGVLLSFGFNRHQAFYFSSAFLFFYIILVGLPASAVRAGLMGFFFLLALYLGRISKLINFMIIAAGVMLFVNPLLLRDDVGFQLSFLGMLGLALVYPLFNGWLNKLKTGTLKTAMEIFLMTLSAQAFVLPIIIYNFSIVSIIAPITNLLVLWCLPFLMMFIFAAIGLSIFVPSFSVVFFLPASILIKYIGLASRLLSQIPFSYFEVSYIWPGWFWLYYVIVFWLVYKLSGKAKNGIIKK